MHLHRACLLIAGATTLGGCITFTSGSPPTTPPNPSLTTIEAVVCHEVQVTGILRSDPADPRVAWLETIPDERRVEVVWPTGYRANFIVVGEELTLEVFDAKDRPFMTTTDIPSPRHTCDASGRPNTVLLMQTSP